jgi:class 3 adenylate cyclase
MPSVRVKDLGTPDETREFPHGRLELFSVGGIVMARTTFEPGWHWSTDVKPIVGTASCQSHHMGIALTGTLGVRMDDGEEYQIPSGTAYDIPPGHDGWVIGDETWVTIDFIGMANFGEPSEDERVLLSILFTDIVNSTTTASRIGDLAWRELLAAYNREARMILERFRVKAARDTGDGFLCLFENAARAVNAAVALGELARTHGLEIRAGIHTGDVQVSEDDVRGVAVHEAARVMALAGPGDVLVSAATRALLSGNANLQFQSIGTHALKGIEGEREIWALTKSSP